MSFYTKGNKIFNEKGQAIHLKGVSRTGLEYSYVDLDAMIPETIDFDLFLMKQWGFNAVRFPLRDRFWLNDTDYKAKIQYWVEQTLQHDMVVVLDLHTQQDHPGLDPFMLRSSTGVDGMSLWIDLAKTYHDKPRVFFELFNEPHDISPLVWWNGNDVYYGYKEVLTAIRQHANNICLLGGLDYAYQFHFLQKNMTLLRQVLSFPNLVLSVHPYGYKGTPDETGIGTLPIPTNLSSDTVGYTGDCSLGVSIPTVPSSQYGWDESFGYLVKQDILPIIATEWGLDKPDNCIQGGWYNVAVLDYLNQHNISYMAWAWVQDRLDYPSLLEDNFQPTGRGNKATIGPACSGPSNAFYQGPGILVKNDLQHFHGRRKLWSCPETNTMTTTDHHDDYSFYYQNLLVLVMFGFLLMNLFFLFFPPRPPRSNDEKKNTELHKTLSNTRLHSSIRIRSSHSLLQLCQPSL